jgi:hypothetical protein
VGVTIEIVTGIVVIVITSMFVRNYLVKKYKKEEPEPIKKNIFRVVPCNIWK